MTHLGLGHTSEECHSKVSAGEGQGHRDGGAVAVAAVNISVISPSPSCVSARYYCSHSLWCLVSCSGAPG